MSSVNPSSTPAATPSARSKGEASQARPPAETANVPRRQGEQDTLARKFAARVERSDENGEKGTSDASLSAARGERREGAGRQPSDDRGEQSDTARAEIAQLLSGTAVKGAAGTQVAVQADTAMLERMAAQISEGRIGDASEAEISFPPGSLAQEAYLQRMPDGGMAIRLSGLDPRLGAVREARARLALISALERRRIKVASLTFARTAGQDGRKPTMSRVV